MVSSFTQILLPVEIEAYVQDLKIYDIKEIGSDGWFHQHERVEKLNMQAVYSASVQKHEYVTEYLVRQNKIPVLVHQLICLEIWKKRILPHMKKFELDSSTVFPLLTALHSELSICNLFETVLFHEESCESMDDLAIDLIDYICRVINNFIGEHLMKKTDEGGAEHSPDTEDDHTSDILKCERRNKFYILIKCLSIIRYIIQHMVGSHLNVAARLLRVHDLPMGLCRLMQLKPWIEKTAKGNKMYSEGTWKNMRPEDNLVINKTDAQIWISLMNLILNGEVQQKYTIDNHRKSVFIQLRPLLNDVIIQQLPMLGELRKFLEHLTIVDPAPARPLLILEQVPVVFEGIMKICGDKWGEIAECQLHGFRSASQSKISQQAKVLADLYNPDQLEALTATIPKCVVCKEDAAKRCSRCRSEWYCRRQCQVEHWSKHRQACDLLQ